LTEQYVLQQLVTIKGLTPWYWTNDRNSAEIDFLVDTGTDVVPIEVKAEINLQAKSLKSYREQFSPRMAVRTAMTDYRREEGLINLPLYAVHLIRDVTVSA
jgi:predicted AAA+ superfamily ATPase